MVQNERIFIYALIWPKETVLSKKKKKKIRPKCNKSNLLLLKNFAENLIKISQTLDLKLF